MNLAIRCGSAWGELAPHHAGEDIATGAICGTPAGMSQPPPEVGEGTAVDLQAMFG
jgi:hypothetical protein